MTVPPKEESATDCAWTFPTPRTTGEAGFMHRNNESAAADATAKFNMLPPGMDIDNQRRKRIDRMPLVMMGESDVSKDTNPESFQNGFTRRNMEGTDDQYTGEHMDLFYGEAKDELGHVGFVERNNYLDRE
jgi:hypothetical protein